MPTLARAFTLGAGDENRTRTISLGMSAAGRHDQCSCRSADLPAAPSVTVNPCVRPTIGHAAGTWPLRPETNQHAVCQDPASSDLGSSVHQCLLVFVAGGGDRYSPGYSLHASCTRDSSGAGFGRWQNHRDTCRTLQGLLR